VQEPRLVRLERAMFLREAAVADQQSVLLDDAAGRISGGTIGLYPPGIAAILPGERITEAAIAALRASECAGATLFGVEEGRVCVIKAE